MVRQRMLSHRITDRFKLFLWTNGHAYWIADGFEELFVNGSLSLGAFLFENVRNLEFSLNRTIPITTTCHLADSVCTQLRGQCMVSLKIIIVKNNVLYFYANTVIGRLFCHIAFCLLRYLGCGKTHLDCNADRQFKCRLSRKYFQQNLLRICFFLFCDGWMWLGNVDDFHSVLGDMRSASSPKNCPAAWANSLQFEFSPIQLITK